MTPLLTVVAFQFRDRDPDEELQSYLSDAAIFVESRLSRAWNNDASHDETAPHAVVYASLDDARMDADERAGAFSTEGS